jgi:cytochrome oxidase Cu insertion factor (SCO1/SenC/PrrC family)
MLGAARTGIIEFLLFSILAVAQQVLPSPQIASAVGKPAPNFTLQDQHGRTIRLASLRGKRVLLIFYRGYW